MMAAARKRPNLATQVGNQGHSDANYYQFKTWKDAGIIKDVTRIDVTARSGAEGECRLVFAFQSAPDGKRRL